ncbi:MAG: hypothetical protein M0C28_05665 [Candidatus Moduliflexus flocculans]|nr:hypothetical protein [Candidatus Moduliflexus flocculans]
MRNKTLIVLGVFVAFFVVQGCTSAPEKTLLKKYFNAVTMNDNDTMSSIALEPFQPELGSWKIVSIGEEKIEPASPARPERGRDRGQEGPGRPDRPDDRRRHAPQGRPVREGHVPLGRRQGRRPEEDRRAPGQVRRRERQDAGVQAGLQRRQGRRGRGRGDDDVLPRRPRARRPSASSPGDVHSKDVEISVTNRAGATKNYKLKMKQYLLRDEVNNIPHRGRWIIIKFEPLS